MKKYPPYLVMPLIVGAIAAYFLVPALLNSFAGYRLGLGILGMGLIVVSLFLIMVCDKTLQQGATAGIKLILLYTIAVLAGFSGAIVLGNVLFR
ncbi:MAG: hypothetical protein HYZ49_12095 [Chloroflexi bacterium]|nr:hypothetical protein [Chloroflexota bacterium]